MKSLAFVFVVAMGVSFASCGNKQAAADNNTEAENAVVIDYGTVTVDSISPDSAAVTVGDTAVVVE